MIEHPQWEAYFVDFLKDAPETTGEEPEDMELEAPKVYEPIPSLQALSERLATFQLQYNEAVRGSAMDLVFFKVKTNYSINPFTLPKRANQSISNLVSDTVQYCSGWLDSVKRITVNLAFYSKL